MNGPLATRPTTEVLDRVLPSGTAFGEVRDAMDDAHAAAWRSTDPRLLELARVRTAQLLGCRAEISTRTPDTGLHGVTPAEVAAWPTSPRFDASDRAALAFTEAYLIDVASLVDDTALALRDHLGEAGLVDFVDALLVVEQRIRLRTAWSALFDGAHHGAGTDESGEAP